MDDPGYVSYQDPRLQSPEDDEPETDYEAYDGCTHCMACSRLALRLSGETMIGAHRLAGTLGCAECEQYDGYDEWGGPQVTGETSDGYHTFNELYHHRATLFSVVVHDHRDIAWKSRKHHDGTMYDGMFIVGVETPQGQATYHYDIDPYWDVFDCKELERAPEWDGHTPAEAIERIGGLAAPDAPGAGTCELDPVIVYYQGRDAVAWKCDACGAHFQDFLEDARHDGYRKPYYCPSCGRRVM